MGAVGVAVISGSPRRACRLFWHGCSRLPKHVVLSPWTSLRVSKRTKSPGQTAHVIRAQRAPSTLSPARARRAHACRARMHARPRQAYRMPPQASILYAADGISYATILDTTSWQHIVCFWRCEPTTSEPYVRYCIIPMLPGTSYATSSKNI